MTIAVYHIAAVNHWREIVNEQLSLLAKAEFRCPIHCTFTGKPDEWGYVSHLMSRFGFGVSVTHTDYRDYEFPAMRLVESMCTQADHILYFHTKSVTQINSWPRLMWRLYMNAWLLTHWRDIDLQLRSQPTRNVAGTGWTNLHPTGTFPGTFWMAKSSYLRTLTHFDEYLRQFRAMLRVSNPCGYVERHAAEFWINSTCQLSPLNFGPSPTRFWDHAYWTSNPELCKFAYTHGIP